MPVSFWIFLFVCVISFIPVARDHGEAWHAFKESKDKDRYWKGLHFFALWSIAIFSLLGTLALGIESLLSERQDAQRASQYRRVTNQLEQVESQYNEATNDLAITKQAATEAQTAAETATEAARPKSPKERLIACLDSINPQIVLALKARQTNFRVSEVPSKDFEELQKLALEPGGSSYIKLGHVGTEMFGKGISYQVNFELSPDLLK
jgi:hypothetical protein